MSSPSAKSILRRQIRQARRQLSESEQLQAANALRDFLCAEVEQHDHKKVGLFLSVDGEIDTRPAIQALWQMNVEVCIPVIHPFHSRYLLFLRYAPDTVLHTNALGIEEPPLACDQICPLPTLNLLCTPLVAFDFQGNRLGMGGGFYDRTLQGHYRERRSQPDIIGLAHNCQKVDTVPSEAWDLPLKRIFTPVKLYQW